MEKEKEKEKKEEEEKKNKKTNQVSNMVITHLMCLYSYMFCHLWASPFH